MSSIDVLRLFLRRIDELAETRLVRDGFQADFTLSYHRLTGLQQITHYPDEDYLRSFLTIFRRFVSPRERIFVHHIYNYCFTHLTSDELRSALVQSREAWRASMRNVGIRFVQDGKEYSPEQIMDLWINGRYFHDDEEKMAVLDSLLPFQGSFSKFHFLNSVIESTKHIIVLRNIVTVALQNGLIAK